jgi:glycosyltransferase involved in cell wall biosynthesis
MNQNKGLVSIGLPVFKVKYFEKALKSLLDQFYKNIEIIILNDASPDDIDSIVSKFAEDSRIRYYRNNVNFGKISLVSTWNKCIDLAKGEFFILASDDDIYNERFVDEMISLSNKYPQSDLFHSRVVHIDKDDKVINLTPVCPEFEQCSDFVWHRLNGYRMQYVPDFMCRTSALRSINGFVDFPSAWFSDDATWFLLAKNGGVAYSNKLLFSFRYSGINITSSGHIDEKIMANFLFKDWLNSYLSELSFQPLSTELIVERFSQSLDNYTSVLLSSLSYGDLFKKFLSKNNSIRASIIVKALGRKVFL